MIGVGAAWYDQQGRAADIQVCELPDPQPGPGEVRVRVRLSGVNPGDAKKRCGWLGSSMGKLTPVEYELASTRRAAVAA